MIPESSPLHLRDHVPQATAQVISLGELHDNAHRATSAPMPVLPDVNPLHAVRARLSVCVGEIEMTVGDLLSVGEHEVLVLDRAVEQPVDLVLEGSVVARGHLVAVDGHFALRITDLPLALRAN